MKAEKVRVLLFLFLALIPLKAAENDFELLAARAAKIVQALNHWYNDSTGLWETTSWWNSANGITALVHYADLTGDQAVKKYIYHSFKICNPNDFKNDYYDDEGWWAQAWLDAFEWSGDSSFLQKAIPLFEDMALGWDEKCGGGLYWRKDKRGKNAIPNALFINLALRLDHLKVTNKVKNKTPGQWGMTALAWFLQSGMINKQFLVNDGLDRHCRNDSGQTWTYNQGVVIGALCEAFKKTGDQNYLDLAEKIALATLKNLTNPQGILKEPNEPDCNGDQEQFKGIFMRHLATFYRLRPVPTIREFILKNVASIWQNARDPETNRIGLQWCGPFDGGNAARQISALDAFNTALGVLLNQ